MIKIKGFTYSELDILYTAIKCLNDEMIHPQMREDLLDKLDEVLSDSRKLDERF